MKSYNRRAFLFTAFQTTAIASLLTQVSKAKEARPDAANLERIHVFSRPFETWLGPEPLLELIAFSGAKGVDITVRPGGMVEPQQVKTQLPAIVQLAKSYGLHVNMITTALVSYEQAYAQDIVQTASEQGIRCYRMGWLNLNLQKPLAPQLEAIRKQFEGLAQLNERFQLSGSYQNHAGNYFGATLWDLADVIKDFDPHFLGVQYDIRHAVVEAAYSWPMGLHRIASHINSLVFKDARWGAFADGRNVLENTPLGSGMIDFKQYQMQFDFKENMWPISLHLEYPLYADTILQLDDQKQAALSCLKKDWSYASQLLQKP
jgi:L-ribulose-5-phosphate 3-epimerase